MSATSDTLRKQQALRELAQDPVFAADRAAREARVYRDCRADVFGEIRRVAAGDDEYADAAVVEIVAEIREAAAPEAVRPARRRESSCVAWLREHFADGARRKGSDVYAAAAAAGFSRSTVERARRPAGIIAPLGPGSRWEQAN